MIVMAQYTRFDRDELSSMVQRIDWNMVRLSAAQPLVVLFCPDLPPTFWEDFYRAYCGYEDEFTHDRYANPEDSFLDFAFSYGLRPSSDHNIHVYTPTTFVKTFGDPVQRMQWKSSRFVTSSPRLKPGASWFIVLAIANDSPSSTRLSAGVLKFQTSLYLWQH